MLLSSFKSAEECITGTNGPEKEPERISLSTSTNDGISGRREAKVHTSYI
jgi:hypothetical protein